MKVYFWCDSYGVLMVAAKNATEARKKVKMAKSDIKDYAPFYLGKVKSFNLEENTVMYFDNAHNDLYVENVE